MDPLESVNVSPDDGQDVDVVAIELQSALQPGIVIPEASVRNRTNIMPVYDVVVDGISMLPLNVLIIEGDEQIRSAQE